MSMKQALEGIAALAVEADEALELHYPALEAVLSPEVMAKLELVQEKLKAIEARAEALVSYAAGSDL